MELIYDLLDSGGRAAVVGGLGVKIIPHYLIDQCSNEVPQAANRVLRYLRYRVRIVGGVVGAELLHHNVIAFLLRNAGG